MTNRANNAAMVWHQWLCEGWNHEGLGVGVQAFGGSFWEILRLKKP